MSIRFSLRRSDPLSTSRGAVAAVVAVFLAVFLIGLVAADVQTASAAGSAVIRSGVPWYDASGGLVNAHGAGFFRVGGNYYMVGEKRTGVNVSAYGTEWETNYVGVECYSSTDLMTWSDQGLALGIGAAGTGIDGTKPVERPKVLYNAATSTYVMYLHEWSNLNNAGGPYGVATSSSPCSGYVYRGDMKDSAGATVMTGDIGVFADTNAAGYLLSTNGTILSLSSDYRTVTGTAASGIFSNSEAPAMFKSGSTYFFLSSSQTWWHSNDNFYATATSVNGPWTYRGLFAPSGSKTFNSQTTFVLPVTGSTGTTFVYMGDRWCDKCQLSSTYVWQPLSVSGTTMSIGSFHPQWSINVSTGTWADVADNGTSVNDATQGSGTNQFSYTGSWGHTACNTGDACYNGDNSWTNTTGDTAYFLFSGTQANVYAVVAPNHGLVGASVCDSNRANCGTETVFDLYSPTRTGNFLAWSSPVKSAGTYTIKLRTTGSNNFYSSGFYSTIDRITVTP
jgi:hypothetical protein